MDPVRLHNSYLRYRHRPVPFPPESVACWCILMAAQARIGAVGDMLECGVQHGGTAFLLIAAIDPATRPDERIVLVDLERTDAFDAQFGKLAATRRERVDYRLASTRSSDLDDLAKRQFRFIHIDAGHGYEDVVADARRFVPLTSDDGVVCFDDFFTPRWPDVTTAVLDTYDSLDLVPFMLCNRKAYFCRPANVERYRDAVASVDGSGFGTVNAFDTTLRGHGVTALRIDVRPEVGRDAL